MIWKMWISADIKSYFNNLRITFSRAWIRVFSGPIQLQADINHTSVFRLENFHSLLSTLTFACVGVFHLFTSLYAASVCGCCPDGMYWFAIGACSDAELVFGVCVCVWNRNLPWFVRGLYYMFVQCHIKS